MEGSNYYRVYDEKLNLLYETSLRPEQKKEDRQLSALLDKSKLFLNIENILCYRIVPQFK